MAVCAYNHQNTKILLGKNKKYILDYTPKSPHYQNASGIAINGIPKMIWDKSFGIIGNEYALCLHSRPTTKPVIGDAKNLELCGNNCEFYIPDDSFCGSSTADFAMIECGGRIDGLKIHGFHFNGNHMGQLWAKDCYGTTYSRTCNHGIIYFSSGINGNNAGLTSEGYMKDPNDHHKLIIDPETAPVVRMIFEKFIDGCSIIGIAKDLNEMGIPNPTAYKKLKGFNYKHPAGKKLDGLWPDSSVRRILRNEMYVGNMVQGKNTTISYKIKQCRAIPKEDWIIVEGTPEAIVDRETFDKAQSLFNQFIRKAPQKSEVDLFSGFVRCADCLRAMNKKTNSHPYGTYHYYRCGTSRKMKKSSCTNHTIRIDKMELAVLASIQGMIDSAVEMDKLIKRINSSPVKKKESSHICSAIDTHTAELEKLKGMIIDLYPDWKSGIISKEEYFTLKEQLTEKTTSLEKALENLKRTNEEFKNGITEDNDFISHFKKYGKVDTLTRAMVVELIDKIYVHEGGRITISFKFTDAYEKALEYIELNKEAILTA